MSVWTLLAWTIGWGAAVLFFRAYRIWLFYYVLAAVGCAYLLALAGRDLLGLDELLGHSVAWSVHLIAGILGVPTRTFAGTPNALMVMVISQEIGWTLLRIGVESSGMLESVVLVSLLLFYPGWPLRRRAAAMTLGLVTTWVANVLRVLVIIIILHTVGKESLVLAHSLVGRTLFFGLTIAIYWYLLTGPTLRWLSRT
jgi:exosortase family protein XrtG